MTGIGFGNLIVTGDNSREYVRLIEPLNPIHPFRARSEEEALDILADAVNNPISFKRDETTLPRLQAAPLGDAIFILNGMRPTKTASKPIRAERLDNGHVKIVSDDLQVKYSTIWEVWLKSWLSTLGFKVRFERLTEFLTALGYRPEDS